VYTIVVDPFLAAVGFIVLAIATAVWAHRLETGVPYRPIVALLGSAVCLGLFFLVESGSWLASRPRLRLTSCCWSWRS
jgi:hypothetical protein